MTEIRIYRVSSRVTHYHFDDLGRDDDFEVSSWSFEPIADRTVIERIERPVDPGRFETAGYVRRAWSGGATPAIRAAHRHGRFVWGSYGLSLEIPGHGTLDAEAVAQMIRQGVGGFVSTPPLPRPNLRYRPLFDVDDLDPSAAMPEPVWRKRA